MHGQELSLCWCTSTLKSCIHMAATVWSSDPHVCTLSRPLCAILSFYAMIPLTKHESPHTFPHKDCCTCYLGFSSQEADAPKPQTELHYEGILVLCTGAACSLRPHIQLSGRARPFLSSYPKPAPAHLTCLKPVCTPQKPVLYETVFSLTQRNSSSLFTR